MCDVICADEYPSVILSAKLRHLRHSYAIISSIYVTTALVPNNTIVHGSTRHLRYCVAFDQRSLIKRHQSATIVHLHANVTKPEISNAVRTDCFDERDACRAAAGGSCWAQRRWVGPTTTELHQVVLLPITLVFALIAPTRQIHIAWCHGDLSIRNSAAGDEV